MEALNKQVAELRDLVIEIIDKYKAFDVTILDVREKTSITDIIIIANGQSDRQTKAIANHLTLEAKEHGHTVLGVEGEKEGEWILIDLGDVVTHIMLPVTRVFYQLEKLWKTEIPLDAEAASLSIKNKASG